MLVDCFGLRFQLQRIDSVAHFQKRYSIVAQVNALQIMNGDGVGQRKIIRYRCDTVPLSPGNFGHDFQDVLRFNVID